MAPNATIYLVEAQSQDPTDLLCAVIYAQSLVSAAGGGEISMSWGFGEFFTEVGYLSSTLAPPKVTYFASSGDSPGVIFPCASPIVVCTGGTSVGRNPATLNFTVESAWQDAGGGPSIFIFPGATLPTFPRSPTPVPGSGFWTTTDLSDHAPASWAAWSSAGILDHRQRHQRFLARVGWDCQ